MDSMIKWFLALPPAAQVTIISAVVSALIALLVAFVNPFASARLEKLKAELTADVEHIKADLAKEAAIDDARRSYEFEAKKRLYCEVEPLIFQLFEAAEGSYYRVGSLVRTHRQGHLGPEEGSWLARDGYYLRSTIYRLFLPIAIFRLLQRSATFVDIELDENIRTRYFLLKLSYYALTDDFVFAALEPNLTYSPNIPDWKEKVQQKPGVYCRQGLVIGHLDRLIDALIVDERDAQRPMNYGEFEALYRENEGFQKDLAEAANLFHGFDFEGRPVLARALLAHAYAMRLLLLTYFRTPSPDELVAALETFCQSDEAKSDLDWGSSSYGLDYRSVVNYVEERISWIASEDYDIK